MFLFNNNKKKISKTILLIHCLVVIFLYLTCKLKTMTGQKIMQAGARCVYQTRYYIIVIFFFFTLVYICQKVMFLNFSFIIYQNWLSEKITVGDFVFSIKTQKKMINNIKHDFKDKNYLQNLLVILLRDVSCILLNNLIKKRLNVHD